MLNSENKKGLMNRYSCTYRRRRRRRKKYSYLPRVPRAFVAAVGHLKRIYVFIYIIICRRFN